MNQDGADNVARDNSGMIRRIMFNAVAAALVTFGTAAGAVATAQENANKSEPAARDRMEAPIGHRQPRAQDLPRKVLQTEGSRTEGEIELDRKLKSICRGC